MAARTRCRYCGGIATTAHPCKKCSGDEHLAHCHCPEIPHGPDPDKNDDGYYSRSHHNWETYPHRHPHGGYGHDHDEAGNVINEHMPERL